ncbi:OmpA family protein [Marinigracilibium pacificum]|uniref:OmpA family protein n=1 Tax=Marinigracilibium pacificum TaxID=2729599 RepID=A0A848IVI8_9BACT|nr:OmpA family protein [Marinigracilibium pacificum]NMM47198.1 OmpA family protein [Marinigracilibium pacificum]
MILKEGIYKFMLVGVASFLLTLPSIEAQNSVNSVLKDAKRYMDGGSYDLASDLLSYADSVAEPNADIKFYLGKSYFLDEKRQKANKAFTELVEMGVPENYNAEVNFYLGRINHFNYNFDTAIYYYNQYINLASSPGSPGYNEDLVEGGVQKFIRESLVAKDLYENKLTLDIENAGSAINSEFAEYVPVPTADELEMYFTSRREGASGGKRDVDGRFFEDIYVVSRRSVNEPWSQAKQLPSPVNTKGHDANVGLSFDGKKLIIYKPENGGDLFYCEKLGEDQWSEPVPLEGINSSHWEASACFTKNGEYIYFSSDRPGGFGGSDIYRARRLSNGKWGNIQNLGPMINSSLDEDAPYMYVDNETLFFSSKGHTGMGGFDIYSTTYDPEADTWSPPRNIGFPVNTPDDDIYFNLAAGGARGYFSSFRKDGYGEKDIYVLSRPNQEMDKFMMKLKFSDRVSQKTVPGSIMVTDPGEDVIAVYRSKDVFGQTYEIPLTFNEKYALTVQAEGYYTLYEKFEVDQRPDLFQIVMGVPMLEDLSILYDASGDEILKDSLIINDGEVVSLAAMTATNSRVRKKTENIGYVYFAFNDIQPVDSSMSEIKKVSYFMNENASSTVTIVGYTDDVGSESANQLLSVKRADQVAKILEAFGIAKDRINVEGRGESNPLGDNSTDEGRSKNRRASFVFDIKDNESE